MEISLIVPTELAVSEVSPPVPLAGAEYAAIQTKEILKRLGHEVICRFCSSKESAVQACSEASSADVLIVSRLYCDRSEIAPHAGRSRRTILWIHDLFSDVLALACANKARVRSHFLSYDHLVFVSEWQRLSFLSEFDWDPQLIARSTAIHHVAEAQVALNDSARDIDVIHCAHPRKALHDVLACYARLHQESPTTICAIVDATQIYQLDTFLWRGRQLRFREAVEDFFGMYPDWLVTLPPLDPVAHLRRLRRCKVMVHPDSSVETGARVCVEALCAGVVPVTSSLGCLPEILGNCGVVLPSRAGAPWAQVVRWLLAEDRMRNTLSRMGVQRASNHFAMKSAATKWATLLTTSQPRSDRKSKPLPSPVVSLDHLLVSSPSGTSDASEIFGGAPVVSLGHHQFAGAFEPLLVERELEDDEPIRIVRQTLEHVGMKTKGALWIKLLLPPGPCGYTRWLAALATLSSELTVGPAFVVDLAFSANQQQFQPRLLSAVRKAKTGLNLVRVDAELFPLFYTLYRDHVRQADSLEIGEQELRRMLHEDRCGFALIVRDARSNEPLGYALVLGRGTFASLHLWYCRPKRTRVLLNAHKVLLYGAVVEAASSGFSKLDLGGDMRPFGLHPGLSHLYSLFRGNVGAYANIRVERDRGHLGRRRYAVV